MKTCPNCKMKVGDAKMICPGCGRSLADVAPARTERATDQPAAAPPPQMIPGVIPVPAPQLQAAVLAWPAVLVYFSKGAETATVNRAVAELPEHFASRVTFVECDLGIPTNAGMQADPPIEPPELWLFHRGAPLARRRRDDAASVLKWFQREIVVVPAARTVAEVTAALEQRRAALQAGLLDARKVVEQVFLAAPLDDAAWASTLGGSVQWVGARLAWTSRELAQFAEVPYAWHQAGEYAAAQPVFEACSAIAPWDEYYPFINGAALWRLNREDEAVAAYSESIRRRPTTSAHTHRGEILLQRGHFEGGLADLEASIKLDKTGDDPFAQRARVLAAATSEVLKMAVQAKESEPSTDV